MSLLAVLVLLVSGAVQGHLLRANLRALATDHEAALVARIAAGLDFKLAAATQALQYSTESMRVEQMASDALLHRYYARRQELNVFFNEVLVFSTTGDLIARSGDGAVQPVNVADRPHFRQALATGKPVISRPIIGRLRGEPIVQVTVPVMRDGRAVAVVGGIVLLFSKNFLSDLANARVGHNGYLLLITKGEEPVFVMHPDKEKILKPRPAGGAASVTRALRGEEEAEEDVNVNGTPVFYSFRSLRAVDWLLVAALPTDEVYGPAHAAERQVWAIAAVVALLTLPLVWWMGTLMLAPMTALRDKMDKARRGDPVEPELARRNDEIGALARAFDRLVSEQRVAEREVTMTRERLNIILNSLPVVITHVDAFERFQFVNTRFSEWYGVPEGAAIGRTVREVLGEEIFAGAGPAHKTALSGKRVQYQREARVQGRPAWFEATFLPDFGPDDEVYGYFCIVADVTEQKNAQDRQKAFSDALAQRVSERTRELRDSNLELETFVYSVAHSFRAPLRAINGYAALIAEDGGAELPKERRDLLARMRESSSQLARLIDGLLRLAAVRTQALAREPIDLSALAREVADARAAQDPRRAVNIAIEPGMTAQADRHMLRELLTELVDNAWKFGARRPLLEIDIGAATGEGPNRFFVRDNGAGFDPAGATKLFVPFNRLHGVNEFPGNGIGLALAARIVQRHGGEIRGEAKPDAGARFTFSLGSDA